MANTQQRKIILFVDDEPEWIQAYKDELQILAIGESHVIPTIDQADQFLREQSENIVLLILDIMMPPGRVVSSGEAELGLRTGVKFYEKIRKKMPELPIIVLTNVRDDKVKDRFSREPLCWFLNKRSTLPYELADRVQSILKSEEKKEKRDQ
jgi:CheY-like chemotaxis protein